MFLPSYSIFSFCSDKAYFVDLFVRASNTPAIKMYEKVDEYSSTYQSLSISLCLWTTCFSLFLIVLAWPRRGTSWQGHQTLKSVKSFFSIYWFGYAATPSFFLQLGYVIYRRVLRYYSGEEDALGENFDPNFNSLTHFPPIHAINNVHSHPSQFFQNVFNFQIWEKHYLGMLRRNPLFPLNALSLLMSWNMIRLD